MRERMRGKGRNFRGGGGEGNGERRGEVYVVGAFEVSDEEAVVGGVDVEGAVEQGAEVGFCGWRVHWVC